MPRALGPRVGLLPEAALPFSVLAMACVPVLDVAAIWLSGHTASLLTGRGLGRACVRLGFRRDAAAPWRAGRLAGRGAADGLVLHRSLPPARWPSGALGRRAVPQPRRARRPPPVAGVSTGGLLAAPASIERTAAAALVGRIRFAR